MSIYVAYYALNLNLCCLNNIFQYFSVSCLIIKCQIVLASVEISFHISSEIYLALYLTYYYLGLERRGSTMEKSFSTQNIFHSHYSTVLSSKK